jgi:release factor glutamine methyltransferase
LVAGPGSEGTPGLADVEAVLVGAPGWLSPRGAVVVEVAPHQAAAAAAVARAAGFGDVRVAPDLAGRERAVVARR